MTKVRLMNTAADYQKLGIDPNHIAKWEDGRRDTDAAGHNEVWYFDGILNDGSKFMVAFRPKDPNKLNESGDTPNVNTMITTPAGATIQDFQFADNTDSHFKTVQCDVQVGPHYVKGDFKNYQIHFEPSNGVGLDLHFKALVEPFRQGHSAEVALGDHDEYYYTDLNVPKSQVTGTLIYDGAEHQVTGFGYHDHQWMNIHPMLAWHHWLWGHLYTDKYTVMIYDFVANEKFNFQRIPFFGIQDNQTGKTIFMTDGNVQLTSKLTKNTTVDRDFPKISQYTFKNHDDKRTITFTINWKQEIETRDLYGQATDQQRTAFDQMAVKPVYMRYYADGELIIADGKTVDHSSGDMIYEYNYLGHPDPRADV